jgi:hypothetical protein
MEVVKMTFSHEELEYIIEEVGRRTPEVHLGSADQPWIEGINELKRYMSIYGNVLEIVLEQMSSIEKLIGHRMKCTKPRTGDEEYCRLVFGALPTEYISMGLAELEGHYNKMVTLTGKAYSKERQINSVLEKFYKSIEYVKKNGVNDYQC